MTIVDTDDVPIEAVEVEDTGPQHCDHSHCHRCGAEAQGWDEETRTWSCDRCSAAEDHERLAKWFLQNMSHEIKEGSLADNVIQILSERETQLCPLCSKPLVRMHPQADQGARSHIYQTTCKKGCPNYGWAGGIRGAPGWLERVERMSKQTHPGLDNSCGDQ